MNLSVVSKYRGELFGISIVSIIIFHYFNDVEKIQTTRRFILDC